ncbi:MAG: DUF4340 domain-containing protein [Acetatifactor sp.]
MTKQKKQILVLVILLVVMAAVFLGLRIYNKTSEGKTPEEAGNRVINVEKEEVIAFSYTNGDQIISFEAENGTWYLAEDHESQLVQYRVLGTLAGAAPLIAVQTIPDVSDSEQYGLVSPQLVITMKTATDSYTINVGNKNELADGYYVSVPEISATEVYLVESQSISGFMSPVEHFIEETK